MPSMLTLPSVAGSRRKITRPKVDLPQPDSPTSPSVSPGYTFRSIPSRALTAPASRLKKPLRMGKCFFTPLISRSAFFSDASVAEIKLRLPMGKE